MNGRQMRRSLSSLSLSSHESNSVAETEAIAAALAGGFAGGEVIAIEGELGAGKTQFVRGMVRGLGGSTRSVSSPTFALLNIYDTGRLTVYHLDAYRVGGSDDFDAIGFTELLEQGGVIAVEWSQRVADLLPASRYVVQITASDERRRWIDISNPR
jgi:tRNA threonylcarbamoyladenosine biosynthesis protein TsaE